MEEVFTEYLKVNKVYDDNGTGMTTDGPADDGPCSSQHRTVKIRIQHECKIVTLLFCIL